MTALGLASLRGDVSHLGDCRLYNPRSLDPLVLTAHGSRLTPLAHEESDTTAATTNMVFGRKKIDLEPTTGDHPTENNAIERSMGLGKIGT